MRALLSLLVASTACTASAVPGVRFANAPAVQLVDDRQDVPQQPTPQQSVLALYHFDGIFYRAFSRTLELPRTTRALGVNALDEVPDSTWFTNRVGVRDVSPTELVAGPAPVGSPEPHKPWTIIAGKTLGIAIGFTIKDARGERFLLKLEPIGHPERETAAGVIINKLMWGFGYNVAEEHVVFFRADEMTIAPDAKSKDEFGKKLPLDQAALDLKLAQGETDSQRRYRGTASRILDGKVLGGHAADGLERLLSPRRSTGSRSRACSRARASHSPVPSRFGRQMAHRIFAGRAV